MPTILFVFHFATPQDAALAQYIAYHDPASGNEEHHYCVLRERGLEWQAAHQAGWPYVVIAEQANTPSVVVAHNLDAPPSWDQIWSARWLYRGNDNRLYRKKLKKGRVTGFLELLFHWPAWCPSALLGRTVTIEDFVDFVKHSQKTPFTGERFIKAVHKAVPSAYFTLCAVYTCDDWLSHTRLPNNAPSSLGFSSRLPMKADGYLQSNPRPYFDPYQGGMVKSAPAWHAMSGNIMVSERLHLTQDSHGEQEYRCFVVGHTLVNISRKLDYVTAEIPDDVVAFAQRVVTHCTPLAPLADYVVDIAQTDRGIVIIEFNPLPCSGRYAGNAPCDLLHALAKQAGLNAGKGDVTLPALLVGSPIDPADMQPIVFD